VRHALRSLVAAAGGASVEPVLSASGLVVDTRLFMQAEAIIEEAMAAVEPA